MSLAEVRQSIHVGYPEGHPSPLALTKSGLLAIVDKWDILALGGHMFTLGEGTVGTPLTASAVDAAGIVLTAPTIRFSVPTGTTVFPRRVNIAVQTAAGTLNELAIIANAANSYTSGGTSVTPLNLITSSLAAATSVTNCVHASGSAITEAALTTPRHLYKKVRPAAFTAGETYEDAWDVLFEALIPIAGPASFLIYIGAAGTAATYEFSLTWAEVDTAAWVTL